MQVKDEQTEAKAGGGWESSSFMSAWPSSHRGRVRALEPGTGVPLPQAGPSSCVLPTAPQPPCASVFLLIKWELKMPVGQVSSQSWDSGGQHAKCSAQCWLCRFLPVS